MSDFAEDYECTECGRHMNCIGPNPRPGVCLMCQHMPGWWRDAELARALRLDEPEFEERRKRELQ